MYIYIGIEISFINILVIVKLVIKKVMWWWRLEDMKNEVSINVLLNMVVMVVKL